MSNHLVRRDTADQIALWALLEYADKITEHVKGRRICDLFDAARTAADKEWQESIKKQNRAGLVGRTDEVPRSNVVTDTARQAARRAVRDFLGTVEGPGEADGGAT